VITLALALAAGYALARLTGKWGERLGIAIFLQDTLWALFVVYPSFTIPFCGVPDHQHLGGDALQPLPRPLHLGLHRGRDQVVALRPRKNGLPGMVSTTWSSE
jgi:hypothetical protein